MDESVPVLHLHPLKQHIIRTILYYDIFQYPLKQEEIYSFLGCNTITQQQLQKTLNELVNNEFLRYHRGYYFVGQNTEVTSRREKGNARAEKMLPLARRMSRLISRFPFVRAVGLSGSISKNYMDNESDVDFFVITNPGRLWIARTLLMLFKKIFLLNSRKYFCVNYFISTDNLTIEDRNVYTATELVTMIPTYGRQHFRLFYAANKWVHDFLPNCSLYDTEGLDCDRSRGGKWLLEQLLRGKLGTWLDKQCMNLTVRVWKRKFTGMNEEEFANALRSRKNVSKHHPRNFQKRVLQRLREKTEMFEAETGMSLSDNKVEDYG